MTARDAAAAERSLLARLVGAAVAASANHPWTVVALSVAAALAGWIALRHTPLDAVPDLSDVQVVVTGSWMGHSPDQVEQQLTHPLSSRLLGLEGVAAVRGVSMPGDAFVHVVFDDGTDLREARALVAQALATARESLPDDARVAIGPEASAVGWVFQYALIDKSGRQDTSSLRTLQDTQLRYALQQVDGVAEIATVGGAVRTFDVAADPIRLAAAGVTLDELVATIRAANRDIGGQALEIAGHEAIVRGRGYLRGVEELAALPIRSMPSPVRVRDVADVSIGPGERRGIADLDGRGEVVGGIVVMRLGENALDTIDGVKRRLDTLSRSLPEGVELVVTYDRSGLIREAIETLRRTLLEEMLVVSLVIALFLLHLRSALIPVIGLPIAVLVSFIPMAAQGLTANIMSLGGIAVAIGAMVDASIILIENVHVRLHQRPGDPPRQTAIDAMREVAPSIVSSLLILTISFVPVFSLGGAEGRLFAPLAFTKTYAMGFSALLAVTLTPALVVLLIRRGSSDDHHPLNRGLVALYVPVVRWCIRHRFAVVGLAIAAMVATVPAWQRLDREFMPPLHEGVLLYMPSAPPGMSATEAARVLQRIDAALAAVPEVERVFGKMGRAETATDPAPIGMVETTVTLRPREQWRPGLTWDGLVRELDATLQIPGMPNLWWMPIQTRTEMLATGVRSPIALRILGDDLRSIERAALRIEARMRDVPGTRSAFAERSEGGQFVDVTPDVEACVAAGVTPAQVLSTLETAVGGSTAGELFEGRTRSPIRVRYGRDGRSDLAAVGEVRVGTVPLKQVARIETVEGPPMIRSEGGRLAGYVFIDPGEVAAGTWLEAGRPALAELPADTLRGLDVAWVGQFEHFERAMATLSWTIPLVLGVVLLLLRLATGSWVETTIVALAVPFSAIGAAWLLYALDYHVSLATWVGLIALLGLDAETGLVMLLYLKLAHDERAASGRLQTRSDLRDAIIEGAARRIRPKLMTVMTTFVGLVPVLWSTGTGADVMKRVAAPMVGGLASSFLLELLVYPALYALAKGRTVGVGRVEEPSPE